MENIQRSVSLPLSEQYKEKAVEKETVKYIKRERKTKEKERQKTTSFVTRKDCHQMVHTCSRPSLPLHYCTYWIPSIVVPVLDF